jgi:hypothetical protein
VVIRKCSSQHDELKPSRPELLYQKLHGALAMENDSFWNDVMGIEFEMLDDYDGA